MTTKTVEGVATRAYGKALHELDNESGTKLAEGTKIPFTGKAIQYSNRVELEGAGLWPTDKKIVQLFNRSLVAKARNKAQTDAFDALGIIKPDEKNSPEVRLKGMVKMLIASDYTPEEAQKEARRMLKLDTVAAVDTDDTDEDEDEE